MNILIWFFRQAEAQRGTSRRPITLAPVSILKVRT